MHSLIEQAEMGDKESRAEFIERFMEIARRVAAEAPGEKAERFSDMADRIKIIRKQQESGQMPGVSTGMPGLDRYVRFVNVGEFFVHCGFSSRGKTQGLVRSSIPAYKAGDVVLMNSLEMSAPEVWEIYDAEAARLSRKAIRFRELGDSDYAQYEETAARVRQAKNDIIYIRVPTVDKLTAMIERYGANTVCVDYVSLMESQRKASSDWERVKDVSQSLKRMAGDMGVRVYAAAQNNRDAALNGPTEDNIANYLGIFQDCNVMVGYHQTPEMARVNKVQIRLLKNRNHDKGPPGDSGYYETYERWDRDKMVMEEWTPAMDFAAKINGS
jgi:replicative DNA helicase